MNTSKRSSSHAKNGDPDRRKGIAHFDSMITMEKAKDKPDTLLIRRFEEIVRCLERKIQDEKSK
jgi:hypothetical protein